MTVLAGTAGGIFRAPAPGGPFERVLESGSVRRLETTPHGVYAASHTGLYRSPAGEAWRKVGSPGEKVYALEGSPADGRLWAGTYPAAVYASDDAGDTWRELEGFQELPSRSAWYTPQDPQEGQVSSLLLPPGAPERLVAGVERGGVYVSDDRGATWCERREGVHEDVHHLLATGPETMVASTGGGLYRTREAGRSWARLDRDGERHYFDEALVADGVLYAAAARGPPPSWDRPGGPDAVVFESTDGGETLETVPVPGAAGELVHAWLAADGVVLGGTNEGTLLRRDDEGWVATADLPAAVRTLASI